MSKSFETDRLSPRTVGASEKHARRRRPLISGIAALSLICSSLQVACGGPGADDPGAEGDLEWELLEGDPASNEELESIVGQGQGMDDDVPDGELPAIVPLDPASAIDVEPSPDAEDLAAPPTTLRKALAPNCIRGSGTRNVRVVSTCGSSQRVKVVFSFARDSACFTIDPGQAFNVNHPSPLAQFDRIDRC